MDLFYAFNETFKYYHEEAFTKVRGDEYCAKWNQYKGGQWVLHTPAQYSEWLNKKACTPIKKIDINDPSNW